MPWAGVAGRAHVRNTRDRFSGIESVEPMRRDSNGTGSDDESLDLQALRETITLIVKAPLRRKKLALVTMASVMALGAVLGSRWKPTYQAEGSILVQRNVTLPNFADPSHPTQGSDFDPVAGAPEAIKGHENLVSIASQTHLTSKFRMPRGAPGEAPMSEEDKLEIIAKIVDSRLAISCDGGIVAFAASWTDPQTAYDLVSAAIHNFLEARNAAEVSIILDAISLLEDHAQSEREGIDTAMDEFIRLKDGWSAGGVPAPMIPGMVNRPRFIGAAPDPDLARRIEEKKQQIREAEDERRRQLGELKTQMAGLLGTFTPSYPPVIALQRKIDALSEDPANLVALKNAERGLLGELSAKAAARAVARPMPLGAQTPAGDASPGSPPQPPSRTWRLPILKARWHCPGCKTAFTSTRSTWTRSARRSCSSIWPAALSGTATASTSLPRCPRSPSIRWAPSWGGGAQSWPCF